MNQTETDSVARLTWSQALLAFCHRRVIAMLFLGFSAGLPILLIFSSLSIWLREAGVERSVVTYFSWAALGYSFKFVWAPLVDTLALPVLTQKLGRRRGWLLLSQISVMSAIILMASINPASSPNALVLLAFAAVLLGFSSATQDIVIDAYRIESAGPELQAMMSSAYIGGYRIAMLLAGAGALVLASYFNPDNALYHYQAWQKAYLIMAASMLVGIATTLIIAEPRLQRAGSDSFNHSKIVLLFLICVSGFIVSYFYTGGLLAGLKTLLTDLFDNRALSGLIVSCLRLTVGVLTVWLIAKVLVRMQVVDRQLIDRLYVSPIGEYFSRYGLRIAWLILLFVGCYRISDIVLGVISNVFYFDLGFSKNEIAGVVKTFGLLMTLAGGFLGGVLAMRFGVMRILILGAILSALTNLLFVLLAKTGPSIEWLYLVISADNLSAGLASAAFVAFLSALTNVRFTAMQYAIFSSLMTLLPKTIGGYSGSMVDVVGYESFFWITAVMGIPVIVLIWYLRHHVALKPPSPDGLDR